MNRGRIFSLLMICVLLISACNLNQPKLVEHAIEDVPDFLQEFSRVNDYPFYVATYSGDYGFDAYLESGVYPVAEVENSTERGYACSVFYAASESGKQLWPS